MRKNTYVLKADILKYFPSIDHAILLDILRQRIADPNVLWLLDVLVQSGRGILAPEYVMQWFPGDDLFAVSRPRGLPIGNLTSQFLANVYLNELDYFIKFDLRHRYYLRYCDDFVLFGNSKQDLHSIKADIAGFLERLRLRLHPKKTLVFPVAIGTNFLGYRIYPTHIRIRKENVRRFAQGMQKKQKRYRQGTLQPQAIRSSLQAWIAHASHAHSYRLRRQLLRRFVFHRDPTE